MQCDYAQCQNAFDVPEVTLTIMDRRQGATWGFYCSHQCAKNDSQQALIHLAGGNDLETIPGITEDTEEVNAQPEATVPTFDAPNEAAPLARDADPEFERLLAQEEAIEDIPVEPTPEQAVWNHINENMPADEALTAETIAQEPAPQVNGDDPGAHARDVGNTLVQLFCGNLNFEATVVPQEPEGPGGNAEFAAVIRLGRGGTNFDIRLTHDNLIQLYFGDENPHNVQMDPNSPDVNMDEVGPFLLQRVADAWQVLETQVQINTAPDVGF